MKKQTSIIILTCSVLLAITNPVNAKNHKVGDVFYCESEAGAYVHAPDYELIRWKNFKFRFKIENSQVIKFGSGYFDNQEFKIDFWPDLDGDGLTDKPLIAVKNAQRFNLMRKGRFNFSRSNSVDAMMMTGTCDKF